MIRVDYAALQKSAALLKRASEQVLDGLALQAAEHLVEEARVRTPVDTGRLRAAWQAQRTGPLSAVAENPVEYASFVEFDTRHWISRQIVPGQKFMHEAKEATREALPEKTAEKLRELIGRCFQ